MNTESRKSLNLKWQNTKFLNKPESRKYNEKPAYLIRSGVVQNLCTPTNLEWEPGFKTSGILTARTMKQSSIGTDIEKSEKKNIRLETDYQSSTQDQRYKRVNTKQVRGKIRKDELGGKGSSSNSSKASLNWPSSLSKSTSRRNEDVGGTKHQKKKSAAIPTRSTKALYSNNSEYEKKRNSKAAITALKPSFSTTHILSKPSHETIHSKMELNIKYPIYEKLQEEKSNENKRQSYNVAKSSRESRKLIEFKLNDDSESTQNNIEKESTNKLATQRSEVDHSKHKFLYPKSDLTKRLISHKSEHNFEAIQNKYGHNPGVKYTGKNLLLLV